MNILQAIILAAGKGTRLKDKTKNIPKALVPINGIPLIIRMLDILTKEKITQENIDKILNQMVEESIQIHTLTKKAHKELISMRCLDQEAFHIFSNSEEEMTERIVNHLQQGNSIKEKVHLTLHLIDMISHEIVYHKHENYNYEKMKTETIQTIKFILKDVLS